MRTQSWRRRLHWGECDPGGIIFSPNYNIWMVEGLSEMLLGLSIDPNAVIDETSRGGLPILSLSMEFLGAPALYDLVDHTITVEQIGTKSITFSHEFSGTAGALARAKEVRVWAVHLLSDPKSMKAVPVPEHVRQALLTAAENTVER